MLLPVIARYRGRGFVLYFRGDAAFAKPELYELLEAEDIGYAIRLPANRVLQEQISHLLTRPVGRPPKKPQVFHASFSYQAESGSKPRRVVAKVEWHQGELYPRVGFLVTNLTRPVGRPPKKPQVFHASFSYQAQSWTRSRRGVAKVEWHQGELYPRVGFIVTNLPRPAERVSKFYNGRGTAEQWIREGKQALRWTRLSCRAFRDNAVRLQLFALAYNLANFLRTLALPDAVAQWSLTTLREKLIKIGARIVRHGRYVVFQLAEVTVPRALFAAILRRIERLRGPPLPAA